MRKFQVWLYGASLYDFSAENKADVLQQMRDWLGVRRLPAGTVAIEISAGYYNAKVFSK